MQSLVLAAVALLFLSIQRVPAEAALSPANPSSSSSASPYPNPDAVAEQLVREVERSRERTLLAGGGGDTPSSCSTGNPIDDCWRCDPDWRSNRKRLADCAVGFGRNATGGRDGELYVVHDPTDEDPSHPKPGTLRHAATQPQPLWITFAGDMTITLSEDLPVSSFKTIDGRGATVDVTGAGCFYLKEVTNVIIHNIQIHDCAKAKQDGDGITVRASRDLWVDHCTLWNCHDGLIDVTHGSTAVTISNNHFHHHDKVILLGHSDDFQGDSDMQVTVAFNRFGEALEQRMPRCRYGYFHVMNNDYVGWGLYAVGGSSNPTINSEGNRFAALDGDDKKEVTRRMQAKESEWQAWNWRSQGDVMLNGAFFKASGDSSDLPYERVTSMEALPAADVEKLTVNAGVFGGTTGGTGNGSDGLGAPPSCRNPNILIEPGVGADPNADGNLGSSHNFGGIIPIELDDSSPCPRDGSNSNNGGLGTASWALILSVIFVSFVHSIVGISLWC